MHVRTAGHGSRKLLWIHGLGESGHCFRDIVSHPLLATCTHLVPDLVGYGKTPAEGEPRSLPEHADELAAALGGWGIDGAVDVVGHSMGAIVALELGERHPALVRSVLDVEGNKTPGDCGYSGLAAPQELGAFLESGYAALVADIERRFTDPAHRGYVHSLRLADPATFHLNSTELVEASRGGQLAARLAALPLPHLYVPGVDAPGGAPAASHDAVRAQGVTIRAVGPSGHWPFIDAADDFASLVSAWLREVG